MDDINIRWVDKDHVWINGTQFISLKRTGEMIRERTEKESSHGIKERLSSDFPIERYRLTLRHDMISGLDTVEIDQPFVAEYCMTRGRVESGACVINELFDRLRHEVLKRTT